MRPRRDWKEEVAPFVHVDFCLLAHQVGKPSAHSLDGSQGIHDFLLAFNVRVEHTQNMLEVLSGHEGLHKHTSVKQPPSYAIRLLEAGSKDCDSPALAERLTPMVARCCPARILLEPDLLQNKPTSPPKRLEGLLRLRCTCMAFS